MKSIFFCAVLMFAALGASAQDVNLDKMPEAKRNDYLLREAKELVKKIASPFYREVAARPTIKRVIMTQEDNLGEPGYVGRIYYTVTFPYDENVESFHLGYSSRVSFWGHNGKAFGLSYGDGRMSPIMLDDPEFRKRMESNGPNVKYEKRPPEKKDDVK